MCLPWWMLMQEGRSIPVRQVPRGRWLCGLGNGDIDDLDDHDDHDEVQVEVLECWGGCYFNPDMSLAINYINWLMNRLTNIYLNLFKSIKNNQSWDVLIILYEADPKKPFFSSQPETATVSTVSFRCWSFCWDPQPVELYTLWLFFLYSLCLGENSHNSTCWPCQINLFVPIFFD